MVSSVRLINFPSYCKLSGSLTQNWTAAYAVYFDHKRRTDIGFRKALKKENRRQEKAAKEEAEATGAKQKQNIKAAVDKACAEGFPTDVEEKEQYFMTEVARGETLCTDGTLLIL